MTGVICFFPRNGRGHVGKLSFPDVRIILWAGNLTQLPLYLTFSLKYFNLFKSVNHYGLILKWKHVHTHIYPEASYFMSQM